MGIFKPKKGRRLKKKKKKIIIIIIFFWIPPTTIMEIDTTTAEESNKPKEFVYVFGCTNNKFYVGKSNNPDERLREHMDKLGGSMWTRTYRPQKVIECRENDWGLEDTVTKQYMATYGIDNVRGGSYCQMVLSKYQVLLIDREIKTANNVCFTCEKAGHQAAQCEEPLRNMWQKDGETRRQQPQTRKNNDRTGLVMVTTSKGIEWIDPKDMK